MSLKLIKAEDYFDASSAQCVFCTDWIFKGQACTRCPNVTYESLVSTFIPKFVKEQNDKQTAALAAISYPAEDLEDVKLLFQEHFDAEEADFKANIEDTVDKAVALLVKMHNDINNATKKGNLVEQMSSKTDTNKRRIQKFKQYKVKYVGVNGPTELAKSL